MRLRAITISLTILAVTLSVNLEVPLYQTYARAAGYSNGLTAIVFALYIAGLLPVLILFGGISDRIGRKPVLLIGLSATLLATALVMISPGVNSLLVARILQGVGVGLSVGTGTVYLTELLQNDAKRAANYIATTTSLGFGGGALLTSIVLLFQQSLVPFSFWLIVMLGAGCLVLVTRLPQNKAVGGMVLRWPSFPPGAIRPGIAIGLAWAVTGLVIAVIPAQLAKNNLTAWSGLALFLVNGSGALVQPLARRIEAETALKIGFVLLLSGYALLVTGAGTGQLGLLLGGAAIAGTACYGFTYLGGLAEINRLGGQQRARTVSGFFLCAYLGFGLPSVLIGFLADSLGIINALIGFGMVLLIASLVFNFWTRPVKAARQEI